MPTKPRTTKKPAKATRKPRQPKPTAEDIGRSIGDALGRRLENLLAKPDNPGFDAVSAWTVGDGVTGYRANYTETGLSARMSPVNEAIDRLRSAITMAECATESTSERLCSALSPPMPTLNSEKPVASGAGALAGILNELAERICADNRRRNELLDRLEL